MPVSRFPSSQTTARICRTSPAFRTSYFPRLFVVIAVVDRPANEMDLVVITIEKKAGSFRVKSTNFQEMQHDPSQMFPKKLLKIPQCVLMTHTKF